MRLLSPSLRHAVRRLLNDGYTQYETAQRTGVSLSTVVRINQKQIKPYKTQVLEDSPPGYDPQKIRRCPGCGHKVYLWPCLSCRLAGEVIYPPDIRPLRVNTSDRKRPLRVGKKSAA